MIPIVTPAEMAAIDAAAPEPVEVLIARAGAAVAREALTMLGGSYGRRVVVMCGPGNSGNDGRDAARRLRRRGVRVVEVDARDAPTRLPGGDLVIDAAFGTGFRGGWTPPPLEGGVPVLAVDIPSGVSGLTGEISGCPWQADRTVTFAALKPGLLLGEGPRLAGAVQFADIGLDTSGAATHLLDDRALAWIPSRPRETHKWRTAVWVVAGSPGMAGAAWLAAGGAQRAGAGYVRLSTPGADLGPGGPVEVVRTALPARSWSDAVLVDAGRFGALVVGNGVGRASGVSDEIGAVVSGSPVPVVVDADGITALGATAASVVRPTTVLTPHDGEFAQLAGRPPGADRFAATRDLARRLGCVVLLKGSTTIVAEPGGSALVSATGDARLATAGTGDVLAGVIGALVAQGVAPFEAAALGAFVHGSAAALGSRQGFVASDLLVGLPAVLARSSLAGSAS